MLKPETTPVVFVIDEPLRGDFANVLGIGQVIADRLGARIEVKRLRARTNVLTPLLRLVMRICSGREAGNSMRRALQRTFFSGPYVGDTRPVAVVSTLGRGEAPGAFVSAFWFTPAIHLGSPKRMPAKYFSAVIAHPGIAPRGAEITSVLAPTRVKLRPRTEGKPQQRISKICLLLGGDAPGIARYEMSFWSTCVKAAIATAAAHGAALIVSTSPRSGPAVEALAEAEITSASLLNTDVYLYGRGDRRDIITALRAADAILVTAESVSMISDAIASGARVVGLYDTVLPNSERVRSFLERQCSSGTLLLKNMATGGGEPLDFTGITPLDTCWSETLWAAIEPVLANR